MINMNRNLENKKLDCAYEDFINYKKIQNLSKGSINFYENKISRFIEDTEVNVTNQINNKTVENYIKILNEKYNLSPISVNTHLRAVRTFLYFLMERGYCQNFKIKLIKTNKNIKPTYTKSELKILLEKPDLDKCNFAEYRNWVIVNWLIATGNRRKIITNVKIQDLDFDNLMIHLNRIKSRKGRLIPMSNTLTKILKEYLNYRDVDKKTNYLFCNIYGNKLSDDGLSTVLRKYHKRRGIEKTSIHMYRHTFAKISIMNGIDPLRLQKLLGHQSLDMTKEYVNLFGEDLKEGFNDYNPLEQFNKNKDRKRMKLNK